MYHGDGGYPSVAGPCGPEAGGGDYGRAENRPGPAEHMGGGGGGYMDYTGVPVIYEDNRHAGGGPDRNRGNSGQRESPDNFIQGYLHF